MTSLDVTETGRRKSRPNPDKNLIRCNILQLFKKCSTSKKSCNILKSAKYHFLKFQQSILSEYQRVECSNAKTNSKTV